MIVYLPTIRQHFFVGLVYLPSRQVFGVSKTHHKISSSLRVPIPSPGHKIPGIVTESLQVFFKDTPGFLGNPVVHVGVFGSTLDVSTHSLRVIGL